VRCAQGIRPAKTLYNRWSDNGVFARIMMGLAAESAEHETIMIDATYLRRTDSAPLPAVSSGPRQRGDQ